MAPKARKVTKKPAAATIFPQDVLKRPSGPKCLNDDEVITQAALPQLEDQPVAKIGAWLDGFSDTEQQRLWKKYQANREYEGTDDNYRVLTKGTGGKTLSKALLKVWISSGCATKGKVYQTHVAKISNITKRGQLDQWQPLAWMSTKYGTRELKARVVAGSIQVRRNPLDPRFPEFLDQSEYLDCAVLLQLRNPRMSVQRARPVGQTLSYSPPLITKGRKFSSWRVRIRMRPQARSLLVKARRLHPIHLNCLWIGWVWLVGSLGLHLQLLAPRAQAS